MTLNVSILTRKAVIWGKVEEERNIAHVRCREYSRKRVEHH